MIERIDISSIHLDSATHARARVEESVVAEYAAAMTEGASFPPVALVGDALSGYWLVDGWLRVAAARRIGLREVEAEVAAGGEADARWLACGANIAHGLRRTNADKRQAVLQALQHPAGAGKTLREIADHCGVGKDLVHSIKQLLNGSLSLKDKDNSKSPYPLAKRGVYAGQTFATPDDTIEAIRRRAYAVMAEDTGRDATGADLTEAEYDLLYAYDTAMKEALADRIIVWRPVERVRGSKVSAN